MPCATHKSVLFSWATNDKDNESNIVYDAFDAFFQNLSLGLLFYLINDEGGVKVQINHKCRTFYTRVYKISIVFWIEISANFLQASMANRNIQYSLYAIIKSRKTVLIR